MTTLFLQDLSSTAADSFNADAADFELDNGWDVRLQARIGLEVQSLVQDAENNRRVQRRKAVTPEERKQLDIEYKAAMARICESANDQYQFELEKERNQHQWITGGPVMSDWSTYLKAEQERIMNTIKQGGDQPAPAASREQPNAYPPSPQPTAPVTRATRAPEPRETPTPSSSLTSPYRKGCRRETESSTVTAPSNADPGDSPPQEGEKPRSPQQSERLTSISSRNREEVGRRPNGSAHERPSNSWMTAEVVDEPEEMPNPPPSRTRYSSDNAAQHPLKDSIGRSSRSPVLSVAMSERSPSNQPKVWMPSVVYQYQESGRAMPLADVDILRSRLRIILDGDSYRDHQPPPPLSKSASPGHDYEDQRQENAHTTPPTRHYPTQARERLCPTPSSSALPPADLPISSSFCHNDANDCPPIGVPFTCHSPSLNVAQTELKNQCEQQNPEAGLQVDVQRIFERHERLWTLLTQKSELAWYDFPWPMNKNKVPASPVHISLSLVSAYVRSTGWPDVKKPRDRIKDNMKRWHPDRFEAIFFPRVVERDKENVKQGVENMARYLSELLRQENVEASGRRILEDCTPSMTTLTDRCMTLTLNVAKDEECEKVRSDIGMRPDIHEAIPNETVDLTEGGANAESERENVEEGRKSGTFGQPTDTNHAMIDAANGNQQQAQGPVATPNTEEYVFAKATVVRYMTPHSVGNWPARLRRVSGPTTPSHVHRAKANDTAAPVPVTTTVSMEVPEAEKTAKLWPKERR